MDEDLKQLLLLCKRLNKFTLEDVTLYSDTDKIILEKQLQYLISKGHIKVNGDNYLFLSMTADEKPTKKNKKLPLMLQYHSKETIDIIIRAFCANIGCEKVSYLTNLDDSCICNFYFEFKKLIYNTQYKKLIKLYNEKPQKEKMRNYFEKPAYFYIYNNHVFVSEKPLFISNNEVIFSIDEKKEFKKIHCYLKGIESHNKNKHYIHLNLAERLWRREKDFHFLYDNLKNLVILNIS